MNDNKDAFDPLAPCGRPGTRINTAFPRRQTRKAAAGLRSAKALLRETATCQRLLQRSVDGVELAAQVGTDAVDGRDNSQRNTGCNQAVFNGGCAGFVIQETRKKFGHIEPLLKRRLDHGSRNQLIKKKPQKKLGR
jgi:hypothetical protein